MRLSTADLAWFVARLLLALLVGTASAAAQTDDPLMGLLQAGASAGDATGDATESSQDPDPLFEALRTSMPSPAPKAGGVPGSVGVPLTADVLAALQQQLIAQTRQTTDEGQHRVDTFHWQLFASRIVFWLVVTVVLTGLLLAVRQVRRGVPSVVPTAAGAEPRPLHELEASLLGLSLKISSPGLGVVILVVSMLFFYMYVTEVFPIREI